MAGDTGVTVVGNLTADPELKFTPSGAAVANFTVASTPRSFNKDTKEWEDGEALFFRCAVWRQAAENVAESLTKGMRVIIQGNLRIRQFERQDGSKGTSVEIDVQEIGPSLTFASAKVTRAERRQAGQQAARQAPADNPWGGQPAGQAWGASNPGDEPPF